jgi:hypothetical protein
VEESRIMELFAKLFILLRFGTNGYLSSIISVSKYGKAKKIKIYSESAFSRGAV